MGVIWGAMFEMNGKRVFRLNVNLGSAPLIAISLGMVWVRRKGVVWKGN